jgi:hypothetical protein
MSITNHLAKQHDMHAPDLGAAVIQARALFRVLSPGESSLISFRIMENGLITYEAVEADLG